MCLHLDCWCWCVTSFQYGLIVRRCTSIHPSHTLPTDQTRCGSLQVYASGADADETRALAAADAPLAGSKGATTAAPAAASAGPRPFKCDVPVFAAQLWPNCSALPFDQCPTVRFQCPTIRSCPEVTSTHDSVTVPPTRRQVGAAAGGNRLPATAAAGRPAADGRRYRRPRAGGPCRAPLGKTSAQDAGVAARGGRARCGRQVMSAMRSSGSGNSWKGRVWSMWTMTECSWQVKNVHTPSICTLGAGSPSMTGDD